VVGSVVLIMNLITRIIKKLVFQQNTVSAKAESDPFHAKVGKLNQIEVAKEPARTEVINFLLSTLGRGTSYLEIGVRNPRDNFVEIKSSYKVSVDPGVEFLENPVDYQMTSDSFFEGVRKGEINLQERKFDLVFIDGLHLAEQVDRDIKNSMELLKEDGFIVLHDCNPPSQWHARENFEYKHSPAKGAWNGTVWKAFLKWRRNPEVTACCIDTDWGVGIISKQVKLGEVLVDSCEFYEYTDLEKNRKEFLNLISFSKLQEMFNG